MLGIAALQTLFFLNLFSYGADCTPPTCECQALLRKNHLVEELATHYLDDKQSLVTSREEALALAQNAVRMQSAQNLSPEMKRIAQTDLIPALLAAHYRQLGAISTKGIVKALERLSQKPLSQQAYVANKTILMLLSYLFSWNSTKIKMFGLEGLSNEKQNEFFSQEGWRYLELRDWILVQIQNLPKDFLQGIERATSVKRWVLHDFGLSKDKPRSGQFKNLHTNYPSHYYNPDETSVAALDYLLILDVSHILNSFSPRQLEFFAAAHINHLSGSNLQELLNSRYFSAVDSRLRQALEERLLAIRSYASVLRFIQSLPKEIRPEISLEVRKTAAATLHNLIETHATKLNLEWIELCLSDKSLEPFFRESPQTAAVLVAEQERRQKLRTKDILEKQLTALQKLQTPTADPNLENAQNELYDFGLWLNSVKKNGPARELLERLRKAFPPYGSAMSAADFEKAASIAVNKLLAASLTDELIDFIPDLFDIFRLHARHIEMTEEQRVGIKKILSGLRFSDPRLRVLTEAQFDRPWEFKTRFSADEFKVEQDRLAQEVKQIQEKLKEITVTD